MSKSQQDTFTDDTEESCPLCVEEFDLSDRNFRPCPCGYQICQFCYNNVKNNLNGLCPACRRPYDDSTIEWKVVSAEEQKAEIALQARRKALARKKETEQKQTEANSRKHLAGTRVVQKNLVYVIGLQQQTNEEEFLKLLRSPQYFGQYGHMQKIVVSKPKPGSSDKSVGVYITFEKKKDAETCIACVDGSTNIHGTLRAQYGTTKYCSAYLRHEVCNNKTCTFLHEEGSDSDNISRQDLSSRNALSSQQSTQATSSRPPPPIAHSQPSEPSHVGREEVARNESSNGPALPSTANWAAKNAHTEAARSSKPPSVSTSSPVAVAPTLAQPVEPPAVPHQPEAPSIEPEAPPQDEPRSESPDPFAGLLKKVANADMTWRFDETGWSKQDLDIIYNFPPLFMMDGGLRLYRQMKAAEQERLKQEEERNVAGAISTADDDENLASGSLQLGGEPELQDESEAARINRLRNIIEAPSTNFGFSSGLQTPVGIPRTLTSQQQEQLARFQRTGSARPSPSQTPFQQGYGQNSLHHHQTSNPFQNQALPGTFNPRGHAKQESRFTFSNDSNVSSTVKPTANPQISAQQAGVLPTTHNKFQPQFQSNTPNFYSSVQGPPPGLKSSGTPPISGGGMFGQGHGFASAMGGSAGFSKNNEESMQYLRSARDRGNAGQASDFGKRPPQAPRYPSGIARVDNVMRDIEGPNRIDRSADGFNQAVTANRNRQATPTPAAAAPGISSTQDFPSLPTPSKPQAAAPIGIITKKAPAKPVAVGVKPVVPKKPAAVPDGQDSLSEEGKRAEDADETIATKHAENAKTRQKIVAGVSRETGAAKSKESNDVSGSKIVGPEQDTTSTGTSGNKKMGLQESISTESAKEQKAEASSDMKSTEPATPTKAQSISSTSATPAGIFTKPKNLRLGPKALERETSTQVASPIKESETQANATVNPPATPSDSASFTTATVSRPGSPQGTKVGSAPVRASKAQQKKERQARAKQAEAEKKADQPSAPPPEEAAAIQEPILGRKKKTKKSKPVTTTNTLATADSTPAPSRPASPDRRDSLAKETQQEPLPPLPKESAKEASKKPDATTIPAAAKPAALPTPSPPTSPPPTRSASPTPAQLFSSLLASHELPASAKDLFSQTYPSVSTHLSTPADLLDPKYFPVLSNPQLETLEAGAAVLAEDKKGRAVVILPGGRPIPGLSKVQGERFVQLSNKLGIPPPSSGAMERYLPTPPHTMIFSQQRQQARAALSLDNDGDDDVEGGLADVDVEEGGRTTELDNPFSLPLDSEDGEIVDEEGYLVSEDGGMMIGDGIVGGSSGGGAGLGRIAGAGGAGDGNNSSSISRKKKISVEEAERRYGECRKETEAIEKKLNALIKRNRRLILGGGH